MDLHGQGGASGSRSQRPTRVSQDDQPEDETQTVVRLRDSWLDSPCRPGDYVHLVGEFTFTPGSTPLYSQSQLEEDVETVRKANSFLQASGLPELEDDIGVPNGRWEFLVDDQHNMMILHPDHLISSTVVADSFGCIRRAVLQDRVKATGDASEAQVYGHILHEIFQEALTANRWDTAWLHALVDDIVRRHHHLDDLYQIHVSVEHAVKHLREKVVTFQSWARIFINEEPRVSSE